MERGAPHRICDEGAHRDSLRVARPARHLEPADASIDGLRLAQGDGVLHSARKRRVVARGRAEPRVQA
eukprot:463333-Alexandrium_andersonii.AAC.1